MLFGNLSEVVKVTEELLEELEANKLAVGEDHMIIGSHDHSQHFITAVLGKIFSNFSSRLCTIYGMYCRNNETAMTFLEKVFLYSYHDKLFISYQYLENPELSSKIQKCYNKAM